MGGVNSTLFVCGVLYIFDYLCAEKGYTALLLYLLTSVKSTNKQVHSLIFIVLTN